MAEVLKMKVDPLTENGTESYDLPDARDGLTPRQRRILWAMYLRNLSSKADFEKTMWTFLDAGGKYGIDGEMGDNCGFGESDEINHTIAQMTQHFHSAALIEAGRGNFGQHGGEPASPRFTEIRLHSFAEDAILNHISKRTTGFIKDGHFSSVIVPEVLPALIPGSIVLGTDVIADGFCSQIPPHNLGEVIDAMVAMIKDPDLAPERIMDYIKGPDFLTGGVITNKSELAEIYRKGRGEIRIRSKVRVVPPEGRKRKTSLVFSGMPITMDRDVYEFAKWVNDLITEEMLSGIAGIYDTNYFPNTEITVELKATANVPEILEELYKKTELEAVIDYQAILLSGNEPARMSLYNILSEHLAFYRDFLKKKNGIASTDEELCQELLAIKKKHAKPRKTEIIDLV